MSAALTVACHSVRSDFFKPIPLASAAPWATVMSEQAFRIALDTGHVSRGPEGAHYMWFVTIHATPRTTNSMTFDRGRICLLVRCDPLAFKSVSQELALGDAPPVFHQTWPLKGPAAVPWRAPEAGATDERFLRESCRMIQKR
jgi:hypothetical protein